MVEQSELESILNRIQQWTIAADSKISVVSAIETAVLAVLISDAATRASQPNTSGLVIAILLVGLGLLCVGLLSAIAALFPRTINPDRLASVTFFGDIQALTLAEYRKRLRGMKDESWEADYTSQIHTTACIATQKYRLIQRSIVLFADGLIVLAVGYAFEVLGA